MALQFPYLISQSKFTSRWFGPKSSGKKRNQSLVSGRCQSPPIPHDRTCNCWNKWRVWGSWEILNSWRQNCFKHIMVHTTPLPHCSPLSVPFFHKPPAVAPIAVPEPWGLRRRTCCLPGRRLSRSCWRERRRQGPAELARHTWQFWQWNGGELWRDFTAAVLNYLHGQLAVHVAGTSGIF